MKTADIVDLFSRFEATASEYEGIECWSARELQSLLGYSKWENFSKVIDKAKESCINAGGRAVDHFPDVRKMVPIGSRAEKPIEDILLTRYVCYLIAQNVDSRKPEIAFAQNYFSEQTHRAEIIEQRLLEGERGLKPENLPVAEDVKKVERRLKSEEKKISGKQSKQKE